MKKTTRRKREMSLTPLVAFKERSMSKQSSRWKAIGIAGLMMALMLGENAQAGLLGFGGTSWKEEALLHDGNKLIVERSVERKGPHEIGQLPAYTKQTLAFTNPATGQLVEWEDKTTKDLRTSAFLPMALDIYQGTVYLVTTPMGCLSYNKWGRPNPPYVVFRHEGQTWKRVPLQELPMETKTPNLISSSPDTEMERLDKRFADAETIRRVTSGYSQNEYKVILRVALPQERIDQMCEPMVYYKCGWVGTRPDGTFNKEFVDRMCNK